MALTDINSQMFFALKVSEHSSVPFLFMSAPGMGKSTTVNLFAEHEGYHLEVLRGNSTSETEIMGYDVVDSANPDSKETKHLRPSWFANLMKYSEEGVKSLLFVDEITTCPQPIQSALLLIIFERRVGLESLPKDTLIVAAGNYAASLGSNFNLLAPLQNRFCIYNIIPKIDDIKQFICHHHGSALGEYRTMNVVINDVWSTLNKKYANISLSEEVSNKILEIIEESIWEETQRLKQSKKYDPSVSDFQNLYQDADNDEPLSGFLSGRTLHYAVKVTFSTLCCFGVNGLADDIFAKIIQGLIGVACTRENGVVVPSSVTADFVSIIDHSVSSIKALIESSKNDQTCNNEIVKLINTVTKDKLSKETAGLIHDVIKNIKTTDCRPIESLVVTRIFDLISKSMKTLGSVKIKTLDSTAITKISGAVVDWNVYSDLFTSLGSLVEDSKHKYDKELIKTVSVYKSKIWDDSKKLISAIKLIEDVDSNIKSTTSIIPKLNINYLEVDNYEG